MSDETAGRTDAAAEAWAGAGRDALLAALAWQVELGVDAALGEDPVDRFAEEAARRAAAEAARPAAPADRGRAPPEARSARAPARPSTPAPACSVPRMTSASCRIRPSGLRRVSRTAAAPPSQTSLPASPI